MQVILQVQNVIYLCSSDALINSTNYTADIIKYQLRPTTKKPIKVTLNIKETDGCRFTLVKYTETVDRSLSSIRHAHWNSDWDHVLQV